MKVATTLSLPRLPKHKSKENFGLMWEVSAIKFGLSMLIRGLEKKSSGI
jgi:hypothetical protein